MIKPTKPSNNLPSSFGGTKEIFSADKISRGYEPDVPDILGGANLNYMLDTLGKKEQYYDAIADFINNIPIAKTITVNANNELVYRDWLGGRNFGELVYSVIPLSDSGLKLLDGSLIQGSGIYKNFVDYIASIVNTYSIIFTTEENWQATVTQYGVCGKFVYDSTNNTVRLPKVTGIIEGTVDVNALGSIVQAGLPNITAQANFTDVTGDTRTIQNTSGAFTMAGAYQGGQGHIASTSGNFYIPLSFNASRSNSIYGKSSTVQPQTIKCFVYMVVSTAILKSDDVIDIDDIMTELNYKADIDLSNATSNISSSAKEFFTELAFPSNEYIDLPLGADGSQYTAPANGYFTIVSGSDGTYPKYIELVANHISSSAQTTASNTGWLRCFLPVEKGAIVTCYHNNINYLDRFRFVYAQGSESEA